MDNQDNVREAPHLTLDIHLSYKNNNNLYISKEITDQFLGKKKNIKTVTKFGPRGKKKKQQIFHSISFHTYAFKVWEC